MESQHSLGNPWSFQHQYEQHPQNDNDDRDSDRDGDRDLVSRRNRRRGRESNDRRHYSYASSTTIAPDAFEDDHSFCQSPHGDLDSSLDLVKQLTYEGKLAASEYSNNNSDSFSFSRNVTPDKSRIESTLLPLDFDSSPTLSPSASITMRSCATDTMDAQDAQDMTQSGAKNINSKEGDVLGHLVQKLQSEVADTRAVVSDLENRLNAAENSNKHIVEELKMLLADAEGTLVGTDDSDSGNSLVPTPKHRATMVEDSNIVYNRICHALQALISEAQSALVHTTPTTPSSSSIGRRPCIHQHGLRQPQGQQTLQLPGTTDQVHGLFTDDGEYSQGDRCGYSSCWTSRRSSVNPARTDRSSLYQSPPSASSSTTRLPPHLRSNAFSRMLWKEKQQEQYERYRRSCDRVSLELQLLLNDTMDADLYDEIPRTTSMSESNATGQPRPSQRRKAEDPRLRSAEADMLQRRYQMQVLSPRIRPRQQPLPFQRHRHERERSMRTMHSRQLSMESRSSKGRFFRDQSVGASRTQNVFMQLYRLWKQTWLRRRLMHVLTGSLEIMLILWVVLKLSEISLAWIGIQALKGGAQTWLAYIYGDRAGAGSTAKELYKKIRQDGLRMRQVGSRQRQESKAWMQDFIVSEAASGLPTTPFTASGMVWVPVRRALAHAVSGIVLAYLSDRKRYIAMKL
ncbi:hypothetical protein BG011_009850 [Mortierella polycephala]|uniref:Uncharacterized protein n=1 Tax=Mortierella polycephala TaxID=41804 RepID=A0A9P6U6J8_9FUNG|nr:hypothetical protein BG011_009850 [Mortierella polycephala]